jgi:hypothetical protein
VEIKINNQPLNVTLENEKTLGEVINGLEAWLDDANLIVRSAHAGADAGPSRQDILSSRGWESMPVDSIDALYLTVTHADELLKENLHTVEQFLNLFKAALTDADCSRITDLLSGIPYLAESVRRQFSTDLRSDLDELLRMLADTEAEAIAAWPPPVREEALRLIAVLSERTARRIKELEEPEAVLRELAAELDRYGEKLGEASILLQTGRDREAMGTVIGFSDLSGRLARIIAYIRPSRSSGKDGDLLTPEGKNIQAFYADLNKQLEELVEAFQNRDSVLIGDLLEYEVAPRLKTLKSLVQELI